MKPLVVRMKATSGSGCWCNFSSALATALGSMTTSSCSSLQLFQVAFQRLTLAHTFHAADSLELRAVDGDPLALHQAYRARQPHQLGSRCGYALAMYAPELGNRLVVWR